MTREEILLADEETLQKRWVLLMNHPKAYAPDQNEINKEYLLIGVEINLKRKQYDEAVKYSEELTRRYGESLK